MFYKNARIFCNDFTFRMGAFEVIDGKFGRILPMDIPEDAVDLKGATVLPGLIDVHSHGNSGADFSDGDYEGLKTMAAYYAQVGVTSFAPACRIPLQNPHQIRHGFSEWNRLRTSIESLHHLSAQRSNCHAESQYEP